MYSFVFRKHPRVLMQEIPSDSGRRLWNSPNTNQQKTPEQVAAELERAKKIRDANSKKEIWQWDISNEQKKVDAFRENNRIQEYKNKLLEFCINKPQLAASWKRLSKDDFILTEELQKINTLWWNNLPEYKALIETMIHIVKTKEFNTYTWFFSVTNQKLQWNWQRVEDYKKAFVNIVDKSLITKQSQKPEFILSDYQEAEKNKKKQEAKEAEKELRKIVNKDSILKAFNWDSREEIQKSLNKLHTIIHGEFWQKHAWYLGVDVMDMVNMLLTAQKAAENDILENSVWNRIWNNRTRWAYIEKVTVAIDTSAKEKRIVPVIFTNWKYEAIDKETMKLMFSNPESINIEFWKNIFKENFWETTLKEYWDNNLWAVGQYIRNKWYSTKLLTWITDAKRKNEVQIFFDKQINEHTIESSLNGSKSEYTDRLYNHIQKSIPGITLEAFKKIATDGKIQWSELYKNLATMTSPEKYIDFEKKLEDQIKVFNIQLDREIKENSDKLSKTWVNTVSNVITVFKWASWFTTTESKWLKNIFDKNISTLSESEARSLLEYLWKDDGKDDIKQSILKLIQAKLNKKINNTNIGRARMRQWEINNKGINGIANIKNGKLERLENLWWDAFSATEDMKEQREFMKKDSDIIDILKKYGYTVDMLSNPGNVLTLYKKIKNMSDGPEKDKLMSFLDNLKRSQEIQIRNYDSIIQEVWQKESLSYISSISGKIETTSSIQAYQFMSQNIIPNVEHTETPLWEQLSRMNIGEVRSLDTFVDKSSTLSWSDFVKEYDIQLSAADSYIIRSKSWTIIATSLNVDETTELVDDMSLFDAVWLNDLILQLPIIKKEFSLKYWIDTKLNWKNNTEEKRILLQKMYEVIFGERKETTDLNEMIWFFQSYSIQTGNKIGSMRPYLKEKWFINEDNTIPSENILKSKL